MPNEALDHLGGLLVRTVAHGIDFKRDISFGVLVRNLVDVRPQHVQHERGPAHVFAIALYFLVPLFVVQETQIAFGRCDVLAVDFPRHDPVAMGFFDDLFGAEGVGGH